MDEKEDMIIDDPYKAMREIAEENGFPKDESEPEDE